jgi:hypothetical protein
MKWKLKILCFVLALFCFRVVEAQQDIKIDWDYSGLGFSEFAAKSEINDHMKYFYMDEWVTGLKLMEFRGPVLLSELLDVLFTGKSLYYYIDNANNVIITKNFVIKIPGKEASPGLNFIPSATYAEKENQQSSSISIIEIGNPADKNKPGNVILSGYITSSDTREPVAGVTIFDQRLSLGTISNQYGFYSLSLPRGSQQLQFTFVGMKEKSININLNGAGEMNIEMNSTLIPLKETVVSANRNMVLKRYEVEQKR